MKKSFKSLVSVVTVMSLLFVLPANSTDENWHINASFIEACSCVLFCPCYFNTSPDKDFCKFNMGVKIKAGHLGNVELDDMLVWISGDLGGDFTQGMREVIFTFEPGATYEQVEAASYLFSHVFPAEWGRVVVAEEREEITWEINGMEAYARLGDGTTAEMKLDLVTGNDGRSPVVVDNLVYWGAKKNNGFVLAKSEHHYRGYGLDFAFEDANGFLIEIESSSGSLKSSAPIYGK